MSACVPRRGTRKGTSHTIRHPDSSEWAYVWDGRDWMTADGLSCFSPGYFEQLGCVYVGPCLPPVQS